MKLCVVVGVLLYCVVAGKAIRQHRIIRGPEATNRYKDWFQEEGREGSRVRRQSANRQGFNPKISGTITTQSSQDLHYGSSTLHSPWDFYTGNDINWQPFQIWTDEGAVSEITDQVQTVQPGLCRKDKASSSGKSSVFHQLICIIHKPEFHKKDFDLQGKDYSSQLLTQNHLANGNFLEIGNGVTTLALSRSNRTLAALIYPEHQMAEKVFLAKRKNIYVMSSPLSKLLTTIDRLQSDPQVIFKSIFLSDVAALVSNHLPDELELLLAKVFSLAQETYVAFDTNKDRKMESFFNYWNYPEQLLENCCKIGSVSCRIHHMTGSTSTWERSLWKVVVTRAVRKMPQSVCAGHLQCQMVYKHNETSRLWLQAHDWKSIMTVPSCGIPLHALLQLGLVAQSREKLMTSLLEVNLNLSQVTARDFCVSREGIQRTPKNTKILDTEKRKELLLQTELLGKILQTSEAKASISLNQQESEIHGILEPPMSKLEPPKIFEKSVYASEEIDEEREDDDNFLKRRDEDGTHQKVKVRDDKQVRIREPRQMQAGAVDGQLNADKRLEKEKKEGEAEAAMQQETNQEDGVAHLWHREMGVVEDGDRENLKRGALVKMSEQWDRENQQNDNVGGIMSDQYKWAAIDKLWTRDEGDGTDLNIAGKDDSRAVMQEGQVYKYDQELGKMIGSLNDNVNPVTMEMKKSLFGKGRDEMVKPKDGDTKLRFGSQQEKDQSVDQLEKKRIPRKKKKSKTSKVDLKDASSIAKQEKKKLNPVNEVNGDSVNVVERHPALPKDDQLQRKPANGQQIDNINEKQVYGKDKTMLQGILTNSKPKKLSKGKPKVQNLEPEAPNKPYMQEIHQGEVKREHPVGNAAGDQPNEFSDAKSAKRHLLVFEEVMKKELVIATNFYTKPPAQDAEDKEKVQPAKTADGVKEEVITVDDDATEADADDGEFLLPPTSEEQADDGQVDSDSQSDKEETVETKLDRKKLYTAEWAQLQQFFQQLKTDKPFSLLTYGLEQESSLGAKICRSFPNASVVTVIPESEEELILHHRKLQESLELKNNLLVTTDLSDQMVLELYHLPEVFKFQILGLSVFSKAASLGNLFPRYLGRLLSLAETTFLEVPPPSTLALATVLLQKQTSNEELSVFKGFIYNALQTASMRRSHIEVLGDEMMNGIRLLKIHLIEGVRAVKRDCDNSMQWLHIQDGKPAALSKSAAPSIQGAPLDRATKSITLQTLLTLGLPSMERKTFFFNYFTIGLQKNMCPINIVWMKGKLLYSPLLEKLQSDENDEQRKTATLKGIMGLLTSQLDPEPFSFLEYGSGRGSLSLALAAKYSNSSIISMTDLASDAKTHLKEVQRLGLWNNAITEYSLDESFSTKLVGSPDFLRYQFIGLYQYLVLLQEQGASSSSDPLVTLMGNLISSAVTTFIQLPSSQALSLAIATFFPEMLNATKFVHMTQEERFLRANHPLGPYRNAEIHLVKEGSVGPSVDVNVSSHVLHPSDDSLTWSLLRVDVRKLNITVNHHFDYQRDGHRRKYALHCSSNETDYEVFLTRATDGFRIPYGQISGVSLIALLRMGLLTEMKERFYNLFLQLPLYEDMAPWNIVFQAGQLKYIDYDTKDFTLDKIAPMAYQVMALLLNYERTVQDFGHCNFNAGNPYGFSYISHCVGSQYKGPCSDARYPVPCADRTCKATYIDCLKAISEMEQGLSGELKGTGANKSDAGMMEVEDNGVTSDYSQLTEEEDWQLTAQKHSS